MQEAEENTEAVWTSEDTLGFLHPEEKVRRQMDLLKKIMMEHTARANPREPPWINPS